MIDDTLTELFQHLKNMRKAPVGSAVRQFFVTTTLPKFLRTKCPEVARKYLTRELNRERAQLYSGGEVA